MSSGERRGVAATVKSISAIEQQGVSLNNEKIRVLCCISGSNNMTMDDYNEVNHILHDSIHENSLLKIGIIVNEELGDNMIVTIWAVGV
jgi:cell division protein FtsZ